MTELEQVAALDWKAIHLQASLNPNLLPEEIAACCLVESGGDALALRYEPGWKYWFSGLLGASKLVGTSAATEKMAEAFSWGPMQIMGAVAREFGFKGDFPLLASYADGLLYPCRKLAGLKKKYGNIDDAISAYNAGATQRRKNGTWGNQAHMDRFHHWLLLCKNHTAALKQAPAGSPPHA